MTIHDLLEYGEYVLREDKEYWAEMDRLKSEIDKLVYRQHIVMAAAIIRLAMAMVTEQSNSKRADCAGGYCEEECGVSLPNNPCVGCNGGICEICTEGKDVDEK